MRRWRLLPRLLLLQRRRLLLQLVMLLLWRQLHMVLRLRLAVGGMWLAVSGAW